MGKRDFLDLKSVGREGLHGIIEEGLRLKREGVKGRALEGKTVGCLFMQASTRTRVSFDVAIASLGGHGLMLSEKDLQLSKGETLSDTARVMSRYVDGVVLRTSNHDDLLLWSEVSVVPVVNAMTGDNHPCQVVADMMTCKEKLGRLEGISCAWFGDINNMTRTWVDAAGLCGFSLRVVCPEGCRGEDELRERASGVDVEIIHDAEKGASGADVVVTDTWISLVDKGKSEEGKEEIRKRYRPYSVDDRVMGYAKEGAIFMHCLPMFRGEEVSASVADGKRSVVWDEAENRLHGQKAILLYCMGEGR